MKIALIGYGKMGKEIEKEALSKNHEVISKINKSPTLKNLEGADIAIEFSHPKSAFSNIKFCLKNQIPILCGTTGWLEKFDEIKAFCKKNEGSFFYSPNFSIGVNIFFEASKLVSDLMNKHLEYKIEIEEIHHNEKKDQPSGTALFLAKEILEAKKSSYLKNKIPIKSSRLEKEVGIHKVNYYNDLEKIQIIHKAYNRAIFAKGVLLAAQWLIGKKGIFSMKDFLNN